MKCNHNPKISVITPSLNQGRYLRQCLASVLAQEYPLLELIVIDGQSSDDSVAIIQEYANHLTYWVSEPDQGQSDAINKGLARATGDLVTWLNADDYYLPGTFEHVVRAYQADPLAPFYFGDGLRVDESGKTIANFFPPGTQAFNRQALVMGLNYILQPSAFINRAILDRAGHLDTGLHYGMDSDLWLRLSQFGKPYAVPATLAATREYPSTKTATGSFARIEELRQIAERHSGLPITPGVICYFLDTLLRCAEQHPQSFPKAYRGDITRFWQKTAELLQHYNAGPDGFPRKPG